MSHPSRSRIESLYRGPLGDLWARLELQRPASYWEENVVLGRRQVAATLLDWMEPVAGRRVLDVGCGCGVIAGQLARRGAQVTAVDLVDRFAAVPHGTPAATGPTFVQGDGRTFCGGETRFEDVLVLEVLEDYRPQERFGLLATLARGRGERIYLSLRLESRWGRLLGPLLPQGLGEPADPVPLLRWLHLQTPYRLVRQREVRRRNYRVQLVELLRTEDDESGR